jgi:hypothetical protein
VDGEALGLGKTPDVGEEEGEPDEGAVGESETELLGIGTEAGPPPPSLVRTSATARTATKTLATTMTSQRVLMSGLRIGTDASIVVQTS